MKILVSRIFKTNNCTIGELYVDNKYICDTLEDKDRGLKSSMSLEEIKKLKVYGETCIPIGTYKLIINHSNRFNRMLPLICDVPGFSGIRIHLSGNSSKNSLGCILVGKWDGKKEDWISSSRDEYNKLFSILESATKKNDNITIEIKDI